MNTLHEEVECQPFNFQLQLDDINYGSKKRQICLTPQPVIQQPNEGLSTRHFIQNDNTLKTRFYECFDKINNSQNSDDSGENFNLSLQLEKEDSIHSLKSNPFNANSQTKSQTQSTGFSMWGPQQISVVKMSNKPIQTQSATKKKPTRKYSAFNDSYTNNPDTFSDSKSRNRINSQEQGLFSKNVFQTSLANYITNDLDIQINTLSGKVDHMLVEKNNEDFPQIVDDLAVRKAKK